MKRDKATSRASGVVLLLLAGCGYGIMAPYVRVANSVVPPFTSVAMRYALVAFIIVLVLVVTERVQDLRPRSASDLAFLVVVGLVGAGISNVLFTLSVLTTTISSAVFLFSLYTVFTPLISGLFSRDWPVPGQWAALVAALTGVAMITGLVNHPDLLYVSPGNILALFGSLFLSFQYAGIRKVKQHSAASISLYLAIGSVIASLPLVLAPGLQTYVVKHVVLSHVRYPSTLGWAALLVYALTNLVVNLLVSQGFRLIRASFGGVLLLVELVVGALVSVFVFKEPITILAIVGSILVLSAGAASIILEAYGRQTEAGSWSDGS